MLKNTIKLIGLCLTVLLVINGCSSTVSRQAGNNKPEQAVITPNNPLGNIVITYTSEAQKKLSDNSAFSGQDLKNQIQKTLLSAKLITANVDPKQPTLYVEVTNIRIRSIASRMMLGFMSGADYVSGNVTVKDVSGKTLDTFNISTDHYESFVVGTTNVLSWIYETFANDTLKELRNEVIVKK
jgi:hypothetical protein